VLNVNRVILDSNPALYAYYSCVGTWRECSYYMSVRVFEFFFEIFVLIFSFMQKFRKKLGKKV